MSGDSRFEMDPGFFLKDQKPGPEQIRWLFAQKAVQLVLAGVSGSQTFDSDIEFAIADYADTYPGFDTARATDFVNGLLLRTEAAVRRGQDDQFKPDLDNLMSLYARE